MDLIFTVFCFYYFEKTSCAAVNQHAIGWFSCAGFVHHLGSVYSLPGWQVFLCETHLLMRYLCRINQLVGIQFGVNAVVGDECAMTAVFDNQALLHHQYPVSTPYGR
jgi:hypothetical protein